MAWSNEAITKALKIAERFYRINTTDQICDILDAAAAVDGDAQREALAQFMIKHSFPTGHGDTHADLLVELDAAMQESNDGLWNAAISEAEELLRTAGGICKSSAYVACADAIRALKRLK